MRYALCLALLVSSAFAIAGNKSSPIEAKGTMHFIFDQATDTTFDGVLFARFVPDTKSTKQFKAVKSGDHPSPVRYISLEPAETVLKLTVGDKEAERLSKGTVREVKIPVVVWLDKYHATVECDSRAYYANLVSVKAFDMPKIASNSKASYGC